MELPIEQDQVTPANPIKIFLDGNAWCALIGEDLQSGEAEFGDSPESALQKLSDRIFARSTLDNWITKSL